MLLLRTLAEIKKEHQKYGLECVLLRGRVSPLYTTQVLPDDTRKVLLLRHGASDFGPDMSFDTSASLGYLSGLSRASLAKVLCACLARLRDVNEAVLIQFGLSFARFKQKYGPVFRRKDDNSVYRFHSIQRVLNHTFTPTVEGTHVPRPTQEEVVVGQPKRKRRVKRKASEAGSSAPAVEQAEDVDNVDLSETDYCAYLEGTEMNSHYTALEKHEKIQQDWHALDQENKDLLSLCDVLSDEVLGLKGQLAEAEATAARSADELARTDAKLYNQAFVVRDLENKSEVTRFVGSDVDSLFDEAVSALPSTHFLFLAKIFEAADSALPEVASIHLDKIIRLAVPASFPSMSSPVVEMFGWTSTPKDSRLTRFSHDASPSSA
ncbi:hypothetical protein Tco_0741020 [Tanacetum coccineum]